jgi:hypothetical protein
MKIPRPGLLTILIELLVFGIFVCGLFYYLLFVVGVW